ncbi:glutamine-rich protein 2-like isoform X2 [Heterodontus francisci]|uniref:glutamine-rich protein 2-like isoform X2 n=1 Tax=Heterodontus francisci TaxID=7792 RepID=UPI00355BDEC6
MSVTISLLDLANLSISHPEPGMVNFMALHSLLLAIIKHLGIQDVQTEERPDLFKVLDSPATAANLSTWQQASSPSPLQQQLDPDQQADTPVSVARSRGSYRQLEQKLRDVEQQVQELSRLPTGFELLERSKQDGKPVNDMWNLLKLKKNTETNREGVDKVMSLMEEMVREVNTLKKFKNTVENRMTDLDKNIATVSNHISLINELLNKTPEQLQQFVSWKILHNTLVDPLDDSAHDVTLSPTTQVPVNTVQAPSVEAKAPVGPMQASDINVETSGKIALPQETGSKVQTPSRIHEPSPATFSAEAHSTEKLEPLGKLEVELMETTSFVVSDGEAQMHPDAVLALQRIRHTSDSQPALIQRISALEKALSELVSDREVEKGTDVQHGVKSPGDVDGLKSGDDVRAQVSYLRDMVKNIDEELKEMRKFQETRSNGGGRMQQQLDKLGPVLEKIMSSSCALLGMSLGLETEATCPVCSLDVSQDASNLCQRFQKLQDTVNTLIDSTGNSAKDLELQSQIQNHILQLQGECERLNSMASQLLQDDQLHQKNIEALFESLNHLESKCGGGNISRTQFDAVTDQINKMVQGLLNKICMQEKDWGCVLERLSAEMDCKLDRIELDPLKKQLEDRWKSIRKQLQKQKGFEPEGAAGLKKQLISHFHCLSCDRPLDIKMPSGSNVISLPMPTYPIQGFRSQRYDIDQSWRRSKGWTTDRAQPPALLERNISCMQRLHSNLCRQIERVQNHFKGSVKAVSPFMRPLLHIGCPVATSPPRKVYESIIKSERIADLIENFPTSARSCGGSHTLTYGYHRRCPKVYDHRPTMMLDEDHFTKWEDTVVASTDTHPPKARTNCKLPSIGGRDVTKCKPVRCPSQKSFISKLSSSRLHSAHLPSVTVPGSAMPEQSLSSECDCQCLTNPSLPCPCVGSQLSSEQPSLSCPSADQPVETLDLPTHSGVELPAPVKPVNI